MFSVVTPCTSEETDVSKEHTTSIFKGRRTGKARNQQKQTAKLLIGLLFDPEDGDMFL
jgi:hypothetical protein